MYRRYGKRFFDIFMAITMIVLFSPVWMVVLLLLVFSNRGVLFFYQVRPGKDEKPFRVIKFKTMTDARDKNGNLLLDFQRITMVGRLIRKLSLDELPQLINVLKGEMSLVGPRPLLMRYLPLYSIEQRRRHAVRPGITGWAQVNGRNSISWKEKFEYDAFYVDHHSFFMDLKILGLTAIKVLRREGINQSDERPMEPFIGN